MARLRNARPKNVSGSYERIFDNAELGALISKVQSAVIASGTELEKKISDLVSNIDGLDAFLKQEIMPDGVWLARKRQIKQSDTLDFAGCAPPVSRTIAGTNNRTRGKGPVLFIPCISFPDFDFPYLIPQVSFPIFPRVRSSGQLALGLWAETSRLLPPSPSVCLCIETGIWGIAHG